MSPSRGPTAESVTGLTRDDFEIVAGGAARPVESFAAGKEQPLSLVLLLDVSVSMEFMVERKVLRGRHREVVRGSARAGGSRAGRLLREADRDRPAARRQPAGAPRRRPHGARSARRGYLGPSPIWDAVDAAVAALAQASGRRAVLLVTDGRATGNRPGPEESGARAIAAGVTVNVVGEDWEMTLRQDATTGVRVRPGVALEWIANATGGLYVQDSATPTAPGPILERLLGDLHERYTLGFTAPARDGSAHPLDVRVKRPGLNVRTRRSYVAPAEP